MSDRLADYQLSEDEAIAYGNSGKWQELEPAERGLLGLRQELLCIPFSAFHEGVEALLGRIVYSHEFSSAGMPALWEEYLGNSEAPTFDQIIAKLPDHLRQNMIVIHSDDHP